jgi:hypothetical protein
MTGTRPALWLPAFENLTDPAAGAGLAAVAGEGRPGPGLGPGPFQLAPHGPAGRQQLDVAVDRGSSRPLLRTARRDRFFPVNLDHPDQIAEITATISPRSDPTAPCDLAVVLPPAADLAPYAQSGPPDGCPSSALTAPR